MNHLGVDFYAHNRGTRRFGKHTASDITPARALDCPFCGAATHASEGRISQHLERGGFTLCPGGGVQPYIAAQRAATMTADIGCRARGVWMSDKQKPRRGPGLAHY